MQSFQEKFHFYAVSGEEIKIIIYIGYKGARVAEPSEAKECQ